MSTQYDPTGNFWENAAAGAGKALYDPYRRLQQLTGNLSQADIDEAQQLDKPLMNTTGGALGNMATNAALYATPARGIAAGAGGLGMGAKAAGYLSATGLGALQGAMTPTGTNDSTRSNIEGGALLGAAGQGVANGASNLVRPAVAYATPMVAALAKKAESMDIPLSASQISGSKTGSALEKLFGNMPLGNSSALAKAQNDAYTTAATKTFGPGSKDAVAAVANAKNALGNTYNQLSARNGVYFTIGDYDNFNAIPLQHIANGGTQGEATSLENFLQKSIFDQYSPYSQASQPLPGQQYQKIRSVAKQNAASAPPGSIQRTSWNGIVNTLDTAMKRSLPPEDAALWNDTDSKWAAMKTVERALPVKGEDWTTGQVMPSKLMSVMNSAANRNSANRWSMQQPLGTSPLADVAQVGNQFIKPAPNDNAFGHYIPGMDIIKTLSPQLGTAAGAGAVGFGAAHLAPEESDLHKHPYKTALYGAGLSTLGGGTLGKFLLSQGYAKGLPSVEEAIKQASKYGVPASTAQGAAKALGAANPSKTTAAGAEREPDPFEGLQQAPDPFEGLSPAPAPRD